MDSSGLSPKPRFSRAFEFEPETPALQGQCATAALRAHVSGDYKVGKIIA